MTEDAVFIPYYPFLTLLKKEILRFTTIAVQTLVTPVITATLYLLIFGISLGQRVSILEGFNYAEFIVPGLIVMGVMQNAFGNSAVSLFMSRYLGYIVDLLVAPITPAAFIMAFTLAAMFRALIIGLSIFIISLYFAQLPWAYPGLALLLLCMASFLFAQLEIIAAIYCNTLDALSMFTNFLILPLIYLGGLFYPVSILPEFWQTVSMFNPLFYIMDGFRHACLGVGDVSFASSFIVCGALSVVVFVWSAKLVASSYQMRT